MVINVEYNQLDPLLRATGFPDGDVNNQTGFSPFPGNINQVIFSQIYNTSSLVQHLTVFFLICVHFVSVGTCENGSGERCYIIIMDD